MEWLFVGGSGAGPFRKARNAIDQKGWGRSSDCDREMVSIGDPQGQNTKPAVWRFDFELGRIQVAWGRVARGIPRALHP